MEINIDALIIGMIILAFAVGIIVALTQPVAAIGFSLAASVYLGFMCFSPLFCDWFSHLIVGQLGMNGTAFAIAAYMAVAYASSTALCVGYNMATGRAIGGGSPPTA